MLIKESIIKMRSYEARNAEIKNKKYLELNDISAEFDKKIKALIPENKQDEYRKLSDDLFDVNAKISGIELDETYKQGFNDGLEIAARLLKVKI